MDEWRRTRGVSGRLRDAMIHLQFKDSRYAQRLPIGTEASLKTFKRIDALRFYRDWYRPELMAIIAVGDFDVDAMEARIKARFSDLQNPDSPREKPQFSVEFPKNKDHGDYATNIAMLLAKPARKAPRAIAEDIVKNWVDPNGVIGACDVAGPGFINLTINHAHLHQVIHDVLKAGDRYGLAPSGSGERVIVEFVSANPTGPLHLGHARGAFMGDAVSRLLTAAGCDVTREF